MCICYIHIHNMLNIEEIENIQYSCNSFYISMLYKNTLYLIHEHLGLRLNLLCLVNLGGGYRNILIIILSFSLNFIYLFYVCGYFVCMCVSVPHACMVSKETIRRHWIPGTKVIIVNCHMGAGTQTCVLSKKRCSVNGYLSR